MAHTSESRSRTWVAFLAGAVAMLAIVLLWLAWSRTDAAMRGAFRADMALPERPELPLPNAPPPEGPRLPRAPLPIPK